jgi:hypothetical protein
MKGPFSRRIPCPARRILLNTLRFFHVEADDMSQSYKEKIGKLLLSANFDMWHRSFFCKKIENTNPQGYGVCGLLRTPTNRSCQPQPPVKPAVRSKNFCFRTVPYSSSNPSVTAFSPDRSARRRRVIWSAVSIARPYAP